MKHETPGTQQLRPINTIGEGVSTAQRCDSFVQSVIMKAAMVQYAIKYQDWWQFVQF